MSDQYVATDKRTGLEITVTGQFPDDPEDRIRIARTSNLFTRLMSSILATENSTERRGRFRALEAELEVADALIRHDMAEAQRLMRETLLGMGVTEEQLRQASQQMREQFEHLTGKPLAEELDLALGIFDGPAPEGSPGVDPPSSGHHPPDYNDGQDDAAQADDPKHERP